MNIMGSTKAAKSWTIGRSFCSTSSSNAITPICIPLAPCLHMRLDMEVDTQLPEIMKTITTS